MLQVALTTITAWAWLTWRIETYHSKIVQSAPHILGMGIRNWGVVIYIVSGIQIVEDRHHSTSSWIRSVATEPWRCCVYTVYSRVYGFLRSREMKSMECKIVLRSGELLPKLDLYVNVNTASISTNETGFGRSVDDMCVWVSQWDESERSLLPYVEETPTMASWDFTHHLALILYVMQLEHQETRRTLNVSWRRMLYIGWQASLCHVCAFHISSEQSPLPVRNYPLSFSR